MLRLLAAALAAALITGLAAAQPQRQPLDAAAIEAATVRFATDRDAMTAVIGQVVALDLARDEGAPGFYRAQGVSAITFACIHGRSESRFPGGRVVAVMSSYDIDPGSGAYALLDACQPAH